MEKITNNISKIEEAAKNKFNNAVERPRKALERFPTIFLLLVTAGVVLVLSGFERIFDNIPIFRDNPILMVIFGIIILLFTGKLYKKLDL